MEDPVIELETRRRIYEAVCGFPGIHMREIARTVDLRLNLVDYHLLYLEKKDLIYSLQDGVFKRYYPRDRIEGEYKKDFISSPDKKIVSLLRQPTPFRILVLLARSGFMTHKEITESLYKSPSTISHHLKKLSDAGAIMKAPDGNYCFKDAQRMLKILMTFTPQPSSLVDGFLEIWEELYL